MLDQRALPLAKPEAACVHTASPTDGVSASLKTLAGWKLHTSIYLLACIFLIGKHSDGKSHVPFLICCPNSAHFCRSLAL